MRTLAKIAAALMPVLILALLAGSHVAAANQVVGTVTSQSGFGLASVTVAVLDPSNTNVVVTSAITDTSGRYAVSVASGTYTIRATPPAGSNYQSALKADQTIAADTTIDFMLDPVSNTVALSGRIVDGQGGNLPGQIVALRMSNGQSTGGVTTDATGRYAIQALPTTYQMQIGGTNAAFTLHVPPMYGVTTASFALTQNMALDIALPFKQVTVHVQEPDSTPAPGVALTTVCPAISNLPLGAIAATSINCTYSGVTTDGAGDGILWLFPTAANAGAPGTLYTLNALPPNGSAYTTTTLPNVAVSADVTIPLTLIRPFVVSGQVVDGRGIALPGQHLSLRASNGQSLGAATTDASGRYALQAAPGAYQVQLGGSNASFTLNVPPMYSVTTTSFTLAQDMTLDIMLPFKQVTVHVQDPDSTPVSGVALTTICPAISNLSLGTITAASLNCFYYGVTTDAAGNGMLWLFPTAANASAPVTLYTLTAAPPNGSIYTTTTLPNVAVTADATVPLTLIRPVTISGRIRDGQGTNLPGQIVSLRASNGQSTGGATTDGTGHYAVQAAPGTYQMQVGGTNAAFTLRVPPMYSITTTAFTLAQDTTLNIALPFKQVTLHVEDAAAVAVAGTSLTTICPAISNLPLGTITADSVNCSYYGVTTDGSGNGTLWLLPTAANASAPVTLYTLNAIPPAGSNNPATALSGVAITTDTTLPLVLQITVVTGAATGGTPATFAGTGFQPGTQVLFDTLPATNVAVFSGTVSTVIAVPPAHPPGRVDVTIVNPNGQRIVISGGYVFAVIPAAPPTRPGPGSPQPTPPPAAPPTRPPIGTVGIQTPVVAPPPR